MAMQVAESDPQLRAALAESVSGIDDNTLSGVVRQAAGEHAEEVVSIVASETAIGPLRVKGERDTAGDSHRRLSALNEREP
jgi:hypothetical protein